MTPTGTVPVAQHEALIARLAQETRKLNLAAMLLEHSTDAVKRRDETIAGQAAQLDQQAAEIKQLKAQLRAADGLIEWHAQAGGLS